MKVLVSVAALLFLGLAVAVPGYWEEHDFTSKESKEEGQSPGEKATNCSCGWTNKGRIVGGRETLVNEFPLMAGLVDAEEKLLFCGAAIITPYHALSACHCTVGFKDKQIYLVAGEHSLTKAAEKEAALYPVEKTIEHEKFNEITLAYDVALIVLKTKIKFSQFVGPACLPTKMQDWNGEHVKVLGWGLTENNGEQSSALMKVNLRVVPTEKCYESYPIEIQTPKAKNYLCTFRQDKDSCKGDSGGPVIWIDPETNRFTLVGLVSDGKVCAGQFPAINSKVAFYIDWIQQKIAATGKGVQTCAKTS